VSVGKPLRYGFGSGIFRFMRFNSPKSVKLGRAILKAHGGDWSAVHRSSRPRADGVMVVQKMPEAAHPKDPTKPTRRKG
jgi:hypothetical protein